MSLLDDLKQQAGKQQNPDAAQQAPASVEDSDFYREHAKAPMLAAYEFLTQLVNQLNEMKLDTRAEYPFKPEGKPVALMQRDYKAYNDSITDPRQITLSFNCTLVNPVTYEVNGRAAVLAQAEMLDRYRFKYDKVEQKDARQMVTAARFRLVGPLAIKVVLQVDEQRRVIKLILANFAGPGASQYHLKPGQLNEAFLDQLGKYILRQEASLFKEELSEDMKAKLRQKLQQERQQREAELQQIEAARQAEEALRKQNSTTSQLKKAVSQTVTGNTEKLKKAMNEQLKRVMHTQVAKGKESFKGILGRLRKQVQAPLQSQPVQSTPRADSRPPGKPAQPHQQTAANSGVMPAGRNTPQKGTAPGSAPTTRQVRVPAAPAGVANSKPASPTSPAALQTKPVKKSKPPKVYNAPPNNPFLKPEPPVDAAEQEAKAASAQPESGATSMADMTSASNVTAKKPDADRTNLNNAPTNNPFLKSAPAVDAAEREVKTAPARQEPEPTMVMDISSHPELTLNTQDADRANGNKVASTNPFLKPTLPVDAAEREVKTVPARQEPEPTMVMDISSHPELTLKAQDADRANGENAAPNNPVMTPEPSVEPTAHATEQQAKAEAEPLELELEPTPVADIVPAPDATPASPAESAIDAAEQEVKAASAPLELELEPTPVADIAPAPDVTPASPAESPIDAVEREAKAASAPLELELEPTPVADIAPAPDATPASPDEPSLDAAEREAKVVSAPLASEPTPVADIAPSLGVTEASLEADLARIIERDKQNKSQQTPDTNKSTNSSGQTPSTKMAAQASTTPESKESTQGPFLNSDDLDLDISGNIASLQKNDSKENS